MENIGLVLEGGGMRGVYTAGVLEYFMENDIYFPYVIGVSAGACNAASYIARQPGRNKKVTIDYIRDPRYLSYRNLLKEKSIFGMFFLFDELPNRLVPFDFETFYRSEQRFVVGTTDAYSGEPVYFTKEDARQGNTILHILQASSSLPLVSRPVKFDRRTLFDGGIADPIPVRKAAADGFTRNVIVLTKDENFTRKPLKWKWLVRKTYPQYTGLVEAMIRRHEVYNETLTWIKRQEAEGNAFVIRPSTPLSVKRLEKNSGKLQALYELGYADAKRSFAQFNL